MAMSAVPAQQPIRHNLRERILRSIHSFDWLSELYLQLWLDRMGEHVTQESGPGRVSAGQVFFLTGMSRVSSPEQMDIITILVLKGGDNEKISLDFLINFS